MLVAELTAEENVALPVLRDGTGRRRHSRRHATGSR
jgi:predicted ABC-type transport system involved in lysophospholipase L1 biosynthesis ATPase subunit